MTSRKGLRSRGLFVTVAILMLAADGFAQQPSTPPPVPTVPQAAPPAPPLPRAVQPVPVPDPLGTADQNVLVAPVQLRPVRFNFTIDPKTPVKDLLPTPPLASAPAGPMVTDDLAKVPEITFQATPAKIDPKELQKQTAHQLAKMNHLNAKKTDAFMTALIESRPDLAGVPFAMGDDCRTSGERTTQFTAAVGLVRQALGGQVTTVSAVAVPQALAGALGSTATPQPAQQIQTVQQQIQTVQIAQQAAPAGGFWTEFAKLCDQDDAARSKADKALAEHVTVARVAALTQMLAAESPEIRLGLVKYLTGVAHVDATTALARMAVFSTEDEVRLAAIDSLKVRREKDYTDILLKGLHYPWPAVAKRSADAIVRLARTDLIPALVTTLDRQDPRLPTTKEVGGQNVTVVREMVKVNHHRNCMMCHSPGNSGTVSADAITAEVPVQGQPLPTPAQGYNRSSPDLIIRVDVTYLRGDFSATLTVPDAHPWPELQRFDFVVRERKLTATEAEAYRVKLTPKEPGVLSPYHRAALAALRDLTGKDTAPTAEAWRKLLKLTEASTDARGLVPAAE